MKTKLLIVLGGFEIGGAQNMVYELLRCIDRTVYEVDVLCYGKQLDNDLSNKIEQIQSVRYLGVKEKITPKIIVRVLNEISRYKPDVVHAHLGGTIFAVLWGILHHKPVVVTAHTKPEKAFSKAILPFLRIGLKAHIVKLVAVSRENQNLLTKYFNLESNKCEFVNNGINLGRYYKKEHEHFTFINVGRQDDNKNQAVIIRCFAKIHNEYPHVMLYLVGDGNRHNDLIYEVKDLELTDNIIFSGNVGNTEDYYAIADCYVQSSHREALPLTALEAMATGLPLVSTNVGGMKDIISNQNGFLIDDNNEEFLYTAMKAMVEMPQEKLTSMGNESLKKIDEYSSEKMAKRYEEIYSQRRQRNGR
ncbi:glycosyltransferase [Holdemania massiliensis]|uniref:glycosyltransferase n=1 Tax=Holdemania massiliensis TaxID=1468449 RepID=UPI001F06EC79|nr:glycosyltransferase [Holdemania massiliensis]MCH1940705.1 glycosyltransferase [Holdemania massiliensis]